jgi:hypothetical protein
VVVTCLPPGKLIQVQVFLRRQRKVRLELVHCFLVDGICLSGALARRKRHGEEGAQ